MLFSALLSVSTLQRQFHGARALTDGLFHASETDNPESLTYCVINFTITSATSVEYNRSFRIYFKASAYMHW
jgi:hypothetical protein